MKKYLFAVAIFTISLCVLGNAVIYADDSLTQKKGAPDQLIAEGEEFYQKGDFEHAALVWEQSLTSLNADKDKDRYLSTVLRLTHAYQSLGYHRKGLAVMNAALPVAEKGDDIQNALFFNSFGDLHFSLGNLPDAVKYLTQATEAARAANNAQVLASVLNNAGNMLAATEAYAEAVAAYGECLELIESLEAKGSDGTIDKSALRELKSKTLINGIRVTFLNGEYEETADAMEYTITELMNQPDSHGKAEDLISLSLLIQDIQGQFENPDNDLNLVAYQLLDQAKGIAKDLNDPRLMSYAYGYTGQLYEDQARYADAMKLTRRAIFYAQQGGKLPEILYRWQWQLARLFKAEGDMENAVSAYHDTIGTLNPVRGELLRGYRDRQDAFNSNIKPVYLGLASLLLEQAENIADEKAREKKLIQAQDAMELLKTAELQDFFEDECVTAMQNKSARVARTPHHTAVIYPITLPDRLAILLTLPDGMKQITVPAGSELLNETVRRFRKQLQIRPNNRFFYDAWQLYDWLIRPAESELTSREVDTLVIAPDGVLRLIPFSTLHDGDHFLAEKYAIATVPGITLTEAPKPMGQDIEEILLGGISQGVQDFSPLPSVPAELRDIKEIMGAETLLQDQDYTLENLTREFKNSTYSVVHMATHGFFGGSPQDTFLLSYDGRLTMDRLEQLIGLGRYRERQVELLTLSACQSALGDERAALGLAGVAVKAGVKSAVATLWFVDDEATSLAVREFYRQLKTPGISKAKALQNAQKSLIAQKRYRHPAYWAPFLLIGNWM
jgi:CHAT domain-containing protein